MFADVVKGSFQMYALQWTAGSLADPDILRRVFHSKQVPPAGFNRGHYSNPQVDALLDEAAASTDEARRLQLFQDVQRVLASEVPYISLWNKTNFVVAQPSLEGVRVSTLDSFFSRVAVVISAVHVKPGRTLGTSPSIVTTTMKLVARPVAAAPVAWIGLLPTSVTRPVNV